MPRSAVQQEYQAQHVVPESIISNDLRITGDLKSDGYIYIDGTINGDLEAASIVVRKTGSIEGNITTDTVEVHGFVSGNITARAVDFRATAHVVGDTTHDDLQMEKGACLDGNFRKRVSTE